MQKNEILEQKEIYEQALHYFKEKTYKSLLWSSVNEQLKRFEEFTKMRNFNNQQILDVGCGFGDFFKFLESKNIIVNAYTGIDIVPEFITECNTRFTQPNAAFKVCDLLTEALPKYDYVVASGIFSFSSLSFFQKVLSKMLLHAKKSVCFNILLNREDNGFTTVNESDITKFLNNLASKISRYYIVDNYDPFDKTFVIDV